MATLGRIRYLARQYLHESAESFFKDDVLLSIILSGVYDLWRGIIDTNQEHYLTVDATNVSLAASTATLTGVPADVFRVLLIQPRDTTSTGTSRGLQFLPADYNSYEFRGGLATSALDPAGGGIIRYAIAGAGAPVGAPTIYVAPQITAAVNLRLVYIPTLTSKSGCVYSMLDASDENPLPGHTDHALVMWTVAHAKAQEEPFVPDPVFLASYATEKRSVLAAVTPRQEQEPKVVRGIFDDEPTWGDTGAWW